MEIVHQVVEVNLPIEFGIGTLWEVATRLFPTHPLPEKALIQCKRMF
jgi:hypothetical protein